MICRGQGSLERSGAPASFISFPTVTPSYPGVVNNGTSFSLKVLVWIVNDGVPLTFTLGPQYLVGQAESRAVTEV